MKKSATPASLRDLCLSHFKILGIPIAPNDLDTMLERADKETLSHLMFLDLLLGQQAAARRERSVEYRIREARFEEPKTLETFDWKRSEERRVGKDFRSWSERVHCEKE